MKIEDTRSCNKEHYWNDFCQQCLVNDVTTHLVAKTDNTAEQLFYLNYIIFEFF